MTRRDFEAIASDLRSARRAMLEEATPSLSMADMADGFDLAVEAVCRAAFRANPNFDPKKFRAAVGIVR